ncbi:hypothetical protein G7046_g9616 [Stylonectria norvegica]|nr:hypothetical protein G7046_g9616 [Stylonectria norvegica]
MPDAQAQARPAPQRTPPDREIYRRRQAQDEDLRRAYRTAALKPGVLVGLLRVPTRRNPDSRQHCREHLISSPHRFRIVGSRPPASPFVYASSSVIVHHATRSISLQSASPAPSIDLQHFSEPPSGAALGRPRSRLRPIARTRDFTSRLSSVFDILSSEVPTCAAVYSQTLPSEANGGGPSTY